MFQRSPNVIVEKAGDVKNTTFNQMVAVFMPWTQWLARIFGYTLGEIFYYSWNDGWFGRMTQAKIWQNARKQIKSEKLAKQILFDENKVSGCKRFGIYVQFYRLLFYFFS